MEIDSQKGERAEQTAKASSKVVEYAMTMLSEQSDYLVSSIEEKGVEKAIPVVISSIMSKVVKDNIDIKPEIVFSAVVIVFGAIDRMITEGGESLSKEQKMALISNSIQMTLEMSPPLAEKLAAMEQAGQELGDPLSPNEEPIAEETEQGVF